MIKRALIIEVLLLFFCLALYAKAVLGGLGGVILLTGDMDYGSADVDGGGELHWGVCNPGHHPCVANVSITIDNSSVRNYTYRLGSMDFSEYESIILGSPSLHTHYSIRMSVTYSGYNYTGSVKSCYLQYATSRDDNMD